MVRLTRIYTKDGDKGETSLGSGARVARMGRHRQGQGLSGVLKDHRAVIPKGDNNDP